MLFFIFVFWNDRNFNLSSCLSKYVFLSEEYKGPEAGGRAEKIQSAVGP